MSQKIFVYHDDIILLIFCEKFIVKIKKYYLIKGNDIIAMLKDVLSKEQISLLAFEHTKALKKFGDLCNNQPNKEKFQFLCPLKYAGFSLSEAKKLNFIVGDDLWKNCLNPLPR
jgi:hypothetical protein